MKPLFLLIHLGLTVLIAWQGYGLYQSHKETASTEIPEHNKPVQGGAGTPGRPASSTGPVPGPTGESVEQTVVARNLFRVQTDRPPGNTGLNTAALPPVPEKTRLRIALWGTVTGPNATDCWAVIGNLPGKNQALYRVGDRIQGASIKSISRNRVTLTLNGREQVLEAQTTTSAVDLKKTAGNTAPPGKLAELKLSPTPLKLSVAGEIGTPGDLINTLPPLPETLQ